MIIWTIYKKMLNLEYTNEAKIKETPILPFFFRCL